MNQYILMLKGMNKHLATKEFETLWELYFNEKVKLKELRNAFYVFKSKKSIKKDHLILKRLTYTNTLALMLSPVLDIKNLYKFLWKMPVKKYDGKTFVVRIKKSKRGLITNEPERELAKPIWDRMKSPMVDLENPENEFNIFYADEKKVVVALNIFSNEKDYLRRMPVNRPMQKPYTLKSDIARACVNLLKIKKGVILDPFCGTGAILLEARDMEFKVIGNDISWNDLREFKINYEHFFPKEIPTRINADCKTQFLKNNSVDAIVTDIPYGKASRKIGIDLYENFLKNSQKMLKKDGRMVVIYANFLRFKPLCLKYFKVVDEIDEYVNRSMTRHILILENRKNL